MLTILTPVAPPPTEHAPIPDALAIDEAAVPPEARDDRDIALLVRIAELQRRVLLAFLANICVGLASFAVVGEIPALVLFVLALVVKAIATYFLWQLSLLLHGPAIASLVSVVFVAPTALGLFAPALSGPAGFCALIALALVIRSASKCLSRAGVAVGLLGASPALVPAAVRVKLAADRARVAG